MNRRDLLKAMLASGAALGLGGGLVPKTARAAEGFPVLSNRVLVNVMLFGGPNLRYLFPPHLTRIPAVLATGTGSPMHLHT